MENGDDLIQFLRQNNQRRRSDGRDSIVVTNTTDGRDSIVVTNTTDGRDSIVVTNTTDGSNVSQNFNINTVISPPSPTLSLSSKRKATKNQRNNYKIFGIHLIFWSLLISTIILFLLNIRKKLWIGLCIAGFEIILLVFFMFDYEKQKNDYTLPFIIAMVFGLLLGTNINS